MITSFLRNKRLIRVFFGPATLIWEYLNTFFKIMIICGLMSPWCWHVMHGSSWYDSHLWIWIVHLIWLMHLSISTAESNLLFQKDPFSCIQTRVTIFIRTICLRSSYPFYIVSYYTKWVTTSWTFSTIEEPTYTWLSILV